MSTVTCKFKFTCPREWEELDPTPTTGVRFCNSCNSNVYLAQTSEDFEQHASENRCVALIADGMLTLGMPEGYVEPFLLVPAQEYSGKQLYLLKRVLPFLTSVVEAREIFYMKEVKIEGSGEKDVWALHVSLSEIGINSTVCTDK